MLDARYFNNLPAELDGHPYSLEIHVHGHDVFRVYRIEEVTDGYVVVAVYPREQPLRVNPPEFRGPSGPAHQADRLVIPYESISRLRLTTESPERATQIGFAHAR